MKAVVIELCGDQAIMLDDSGCFTKVRNKGNMQVGMEIELQSQKHADWMRVARVASIAAVFLLAVGISYGAYSYNMPYSYINLDINPSVEIVTNRYDRALKVEGLNEDGEKLISDVAVKYKKAGQAVDALVEKAVKAGYLKPDTSNYMVVAVSSKDQKKAEDLGGTLKNDVEKQLEGENIKTQVIKENLSMERHDTAKEIGVSPGKLLLIEKLMEVNPDTRVEDYKERPVKDIMKAIIDGTAHEKTGTSGAAEGNASAVKGGNSNTDGKNVNGNESGSEKSSKEGNGFKGEDESSDMSPADSLQNNTQTTAEDEKLKEDKDTSGNNNGNSNGKSSNGTGTDEKRTSGEDDKGNTDKDSKDNNGNQGGGSSIPGNEKSDSQSNGSSHNNGAQSDNGTVNANNGKNETLKDKDSGNDKGNGNGGGNSKK